MRPFARALREGDIALARILWGAITARLGVVPLPDHEGELFEGVLVPRDGAVSPRTVDELARSWERLDRAYAPCEDADLEAEVRAIVRELAESSGLTHGLGDDHLFVVLGERGEARAVARFPDEAWAGLFPHAPVGGDATATAIFAAQRDLFDP